MAQWLCETVGFSGGVTAIDANPVLLDLIPAQNLSVQEMDVRTGELRRESYDLVTCTRCCTNRRRCARDAHEDGRRRQAGRMAPGPEPDFHLAPTTEPEVWSRTWNGLIEWGQGNGIDWLIGRRLPSMVAALGLGYPEAKTDVQNIRGRDRGVVLPAVLRQVRDRVVQAGHLDATTLDAASALLDDPTYWTQCWMMTAVWVRKRLE